MTMTQTASLYQSLCNLGILASDAQILHDNFTEPVNDFIAGMDHVARILLGIEAPGIAPPISQPWKDIHTSMNSANTVVDGYTNAVSTFPANIQQAIYGVISVRMQVLDAINQQSGNKKDYKTIDYINKLQDLGYNLRLNQCNNIIEVNGDPITDFIRADIHNLMEDAGFKVTHKIDNACSSYAKMNAYHPIKEYFNCLFYDGRNYIESLTNYFVDQHKIFPIFLRKWLIGTVAKVFEQGFNPVLVLDGSQRLGKSYFVHWLCPLKDYFIEKNINPDDKDDQIRLMSKWIWEVAELGSTTRKADREALKAFISMRTVQTRRAYDRFDTIKPAMASFIGTINNEAGFLSDPTGNRRFLTCKITSLNWDYSKDIDVNTVWAEAHAAYLAGESWQLTEDEIKQANAINEFYEIEDPIEGKIKKFFKVEPDNKFLWTATADILELLEDPNRGALHGNTKANSMALSATMTRIGLEKKKQTNQYGQRVWGYYGIEKKAP